MWESTTAIVREAPLLGHGLGSFPEQYRRVVSERYQGWKATLTADPHNQYLLILAETGLLGLAAFSWFLFSALRQPASGPFRLVGIALLLAWCLTSLFSSHFHTFNEGHLIAIFLGVCLAPEFAKGSQSRSRRVDGRSNFLITWPAAARTDQRGSCAPRPCFLGLGDAKDTDQSRPGRCRQDARPRCHWRQPGTHPQGLQRKLRHLIRAIQWRLATPCVLQRIHSDPASRRLACRRPSSSAFSRVKPSHAFDFPAMKSDCYRAEHDVFRT